VLEEAEMDERSERQSQAGNGTRTCGALALLDAQRWRVSGGQEVSPMPDDFDPTVEPPDPSERAGPVNAAARPRSRAPRSAGRSAGRGARSNSADDGDGGEEDADSVRADRPPDGGAAAGSAAVAERQLPIFLTVPEAAALLRTTPKGIYAMVERGFLRGAVRRFGRRVLLKRAALLTSTDARLGPSSGRS
jgi:excisionase family DNA binding protein